MQAHAVSPAPRAHPDYASLVQINKVHSSLYYDEQVYKDEIERIWNRSWVYVGHTSEVPNRNDYVIKSIGPTPVLLVHNRHGEISLLQNKCPHRGNLLCAYQKGNRSSFTCPYHAWTFANSGELTGLAFADGYEGVDKSQFSLGKVPRIAVYRGFVFGSFAKDGPTLEEYLGDARRAIDQLLENSPDGELDLTAGFLQHRTQANWKFLVENETDGYHPGSVHSSIFQVASSPVPSLYKPGSPALTRDYGNGHTEFDLRPAWRQAGKPMHWFNTSVDRLPQYAEAMRKSYGAEKAQQIMIDGSPHIMIFPNLFIAEIQMFVIQPISVNETIQHVTALQFKGAPDFNRRLRQQTMGSVGPAGFLLADDTEMYERNHRGALIDNPEWIVLMRGEKRETRDEDGHRIGHSTDEVPQRGIWRHYLKMMTA